ncbi:MAG: hypothetical protein RAO92_00150 [Candidatus Euphemobacter frigidus]|nr:hypothetical protein [Candidatus Euphemobacter frigidus]MDP8274789.1 hypothetical protein [Candidatus Euphemobacter frigidus]
MKPEKKDRSAKKPGPKKIKNSDKGEGKPVAGNPPDREEEKPQRRLIPFTAGRLPSVSRAMPPAASMIPLVSKEIPLITSSFPQVSAKPGITIPRKWGIMPDRKWGTDIYPGAEKRKLDRPTDIGLFKFLGKVLTAPYQPVEMIKGLTAAIHSRAEEDIEPRAVLEQGLLELKMLREMGEITEEDYQEKAALIQEEIDKLKGD